MSSQVTTGDDPALTAFLDAVVRALGDRFVSVVLYGSAARGDFVERASDLNLLVVARDLELDTLERLSAPFESWRRNGQPQPRLFSRPMLKASADVFPIEYLEILSCRRVLRGVDPFADIEVHLDFLRLQCERELREKLMRLREGYIEAHQDSKRLERLLIESYTTFAAIFRGCLNLLGEAPPISIDETTQRFCAVAEVDATPFFEIVGLRHGNHVSDVRALFRRYYAALDLSVDHIDRFGKFRA